MCTEGVSMPIHKYGLACNQDFQKGGLRAPYNTHMDKSLGEWRLNGPLENLQLSLLLFLDLQGVDLERFVGVHSNPFFSELNTALAATNSSFPRHNMKLH